MKRYFFILVLLVIIGLVAEVSGYIGIILLNKRFQYSDMIDIPESVRPDWYGKPYFRLREILMNKPGCLPKFYPCYNLNYALTPGFFSNGVYQHNEDGYRGPKINCAKGDKYRILFLGGSTTYGLVKKPDETFPAQTGKMLDQYFGATHQKWPGAEVINAGMEGAQLSEELHSYLFKYRYYKPDLVVIHSAGNDGNNDIGSDYTPDYAGLRDFKVWEIERIMPAWMFHSYFASFIAFATYYDKRGVDMDVASTVSSTSPKPDWFPAAMAEQIKTGSDTLDPFYNNFETLVSEIESDSAAVLVIPFALNPRFKDYFARHGSNYWRNVARYNRMMKEIAEKHHEHWVDYRYESVQPQWWFDHCHVTAEGEKEKAHLITKSIIDLLNGPDR